ncbi:MAG TPA: 3-oxoacyl-ACP reductase family protein [Pyrinomonadaceae bacterium]|nr:3-oxoacyl-ACP reductase family protein [Pyrinomonadaceae bacterium]
MKLEDVRLRGRVAVVTGGSRGIGRAVVELFAELGADVVVNYRKDAAAAESSVNAAREKGAVALSFGGDIAEVATAQLLIDFAVKRFKRVDLLICNAGIWEGSPVDVMTEELWDRTTDINLKGTWAVCRAAIPVMKQQKFGKIVIVTSTAGQRGEANYSNYAASKGGQIAFTKSLAEELGEWGINVNAVAPGWVATEMTSDALRDSEHRAAAARQIPLGRIATPEEIAAPIAFLCSDWARHITGEILNVNGGAVLCG